MDKIEIIGAGPAGASAAYYLAKSGYNVVLYEANERLAKKPCGLGIPSTKDLPIEIKKEFIDRVIKGVTLYVDEMKTVDENDFLEGYIINKESFLESLVVESGAELRKKSTYNPLRSMVRENGKLKEVKKGILAGGFTFYKGEKINALQTVVKSRDLEDLNKLIIFFDTEIIGYYWIFPGINGTEVGIGGYRDINNLKKLLERFIRKNYMLKASKVISPMVGAQIAVGGVSLDMYKNLTKIGEAAGFVFPLTGEGIRPSIISGIEVAKAIVNGKEPRERLEKADITKAIKIQRKILRRVQAMERDKRREFLSLMPAQVHAEVALGRMNKQRIAIALARRPDLAIKLLKYIGD
ncbi:MAG: NAD(P)/FAD-dependent oxidoreductase [Caldisphaeraceae archaeon]|nr:NAD(P)/FAD-dependent oxidoreductase [Caldisphaeraceae archaeon]